MNKGEYDIVVVGAGPAGSTAAKSAAEGGADVLLIDKRREIGIPVQCGEALSELVLGEFGIKPDPRWAVNKIDSAKLVSPSGQAVRIRQRRSDKIGYILDRKVFDEFLAIRAVRSGSEMSVATFVNGLVQEDGEIKGVSYESQEDEGVVNAELVIAADGVGSRVGNWAGIETKLGTDELESGVQFKMAGVEFESKFMMEFYFGAKVAPGGYAWIFPKDEDVANVGLGVLPARAEKSAMEYLKDFVSSKPNLRNGEIFEVDAGGVPVSGPLEKTFAEKILLVGDAARQVNPLTGGGIDWSMRAGDIAGKVAADAVLEGNTSESRLEEYQVRWEKVMGDKLEKYNKGKNVLLDLSDGELDDVAEALQDVDFKEISLTDILKAVIKKKPRLLWKLRGFL